MRKITGKKLLKKDLAVILFLTLVIILFFMRLFFPKPSIFITPEYGKTDILNFNLSVKYFLSQSLRSFELPFWNKNIGMGFPILAESQIGAFFLPNILLFGLLPTWLAFNFSYILAFLTAGIGMYILAKKLKFSVFTSLLMALTFSFSGFFIGHIQHLNFIQSASFLPWLVYLAMNMYSNKNTVNIGLFSLILSQQIFAGHLQMPALTLIFIFLFTVYLSSFKITATLKNWRILLFAFFISLLLSLIQIIPSRELLANSIRAGGFNSVSSLQYAYPFKHFLTFLNPFILGKVSNGTYSADVSTKGSVFWENTGYVGIFPLILVFFAFIKLQKNKLLQISLLILLFSGLMMLGGNSPLYFLHSVPPLTYFRDPSRYLLIFITALVIISGIGMEILNKSLLKRIPPKIKIAIFAFIIIFVIGDFFYQWFFYHAVFPEKEWLKDPETAIYLKQHLKEGEKIITLPEGKLWYDYFTKNGWKETKPYFYFRNELDPNTNLLWNIPTYDAYVGVVNIKRSDALRTILLNVVIENIDKKSVITLSKAGLNLLNMNGISHVISPDIIKDPNLILVYTTKDNVNGFPSYKIYRNKKVLPRASIVHSYIKAETLHQMQNALLSKSFNPSTTIILEKDIKLKNNQKTYKISDKIMWINDNNLESEFNIETAQESLFILRDTYYPGWKAYIDGRETKIFPANLAQRAIIIPAGTHLIKFLYKPTNLMLALGISGITHLIVLFFIFRPRLVN